MATGKEQHHSPCLQGNITAEFLGHALTAMPAHGARPGQAELSHNAAGTLEGVPHGEEGTTAPFARSASP